MNRDPLGSSLGADTHTRPDAGTLAVESASYSDVATPLHAAAKALGWDTEIGAFGSVIRPGDRVLIKPNLVMHVNKGPWGVEPLYTHPAVVREVVHEALAAKPARLVVGDAPLQSCDWDRLMAETRLGEWAADLSSQDRSFGGIKDFRRTKSVYKDGIRQPNEDQLPLTEFVLFDLASESLLEPITETPSTFRVTQYDPGKLQMTHRRGRHQYLIARDVLEADVVINLPKLKTHKKAGVTCALKNLIGINGNKEFLPHHRLGGSLSGGDCYPGNSLSKRALEYALDRVNSAQRMVERRFWHLAKRVFDRISISGGDELGVEGSWQGNDTIWRTCLDLNRILIYGKEDGTMAETPQRRIIHIADAIVAGHGDGPLSPEPVPLGFLLATGSAAAMDWAGAYLLGYDPMQLPLVREAFASFRWPIAQVPPERLQVRGALGHGALAPILSRWNQPSLHYPIGWLPAVRADAVTVTV